MKKRRFGIQIHSTHTIFHFSKFKFFILNERKLNGDIKLDRWYPKIFGFYFFIDIEKFKNSIITEYFDENNNLEDWIDYVSIKRKNNCWCMREFKKDKKFTCPCGQSEEIIKVRVFEKNS